MAKAARSAPGLGALARPGERLDRLSARLGLAGAFLAVTAAGFELIGWTASAERAAALWTPLDRAIPFVPWTVFLYSWVYTAMAYPLFVVRDGRLFGQVVKAYGLVVGVSLLTFALFPVTSAALRPDVSSLDTATFAGWATRLTYHVDPPFNLFPSLHLSAAAVSALAAYRARPAFGWLAAPVVVGVGLSILTLKQHFVLDGVAALVLAGVAWALFLRPVTQAASEWSGRPLATSWRGPVAYLAFHGTFYAGFFAAWRLGWAPWA